MYVAHLSDLHICALEKSRTLRVRRLVDKVNGLSILPKFVVVTGDLVDEDVLENYDICFNELNRLSVPYYVVMGNHDKFEGLRGVIEKYCPNHPKSEDSESLSYEVDFGSLKMIVIDNSEEFVLDINKFKSRHSWLEEKLKSSDKPVLLACHKPLSKTNMMYFDEYYDRAFDVLASLVSKYKEKIKLIISGHVHNSMVNCVGGVSVVSTFSPAYRLNMDFEEESLFLSEEVFSAFHVHYFGKDGFLSYVVPVSMEKI